MIFNTLRILCMQLKLIERNYFPAAKKINDHQLKKKDAIYEIYKSYGLRLVSLLYIIVIPVKS